MDAAQFDERQRAPAFSSGYLRDWLLVDWGGPLVNRAHQTQESRETGRENHGHGVSGVI